MQMVAEGEMRDIRERVVVAKRGEFVELEKGGRN